MGGEQLLRTAVIKGDGYIALQSVYTTGIHRLQLNATGEAELWEYQNNQWVRTQTLGPKPKTVTKTLTVNTYGNVDLGLSVNSVIVLGARRTGTSSSNHNLIPFANTSYWYAYAVKNAAGTSMTLESSGVQMDVEIWYIDKT